MRAARVLSVLAGLVLCLAASPALAQPEPPVLNPPEPLLAPGQPVEWWFAFKFAAATRPYRPPAGTRTCAFGGEPEPYGARRFNQAYVVADSTDPTLREPRAPLGVGDADPLGATFGQVWRGAYFFVVWNDQFYRDPALCGASNSCASPWGHSKGMIAWNADGEGFILQVTTPSWPAAASSTAPRLTDGNTLGCIDDNNILVAQHFFALRLGHEDLVMALKALANASVVTDPDNPQIVRNGGPDDVQDLVRGLGVKSQSDQPLTFLLSSHVLLISKPSALRVPPWQMVSALLQGEPLRVATWWAAPQISSTTAGEVFDCWEASLGSPGRVQIATMGRWRYGTSGHSVTFGLTGVPSANGNHAKIGVSMGEDRRYTIFGDLNQQGVLNGDCKRSQNGRGGLFFVIDNRELSASVGRLLNTSTSPTL